MYEILEKKTLAPIIKEISVYAPQIVRKCKAGQFVILLTHEKGERIPLTIADWDREEGNLVMVFQEMGKSTTFLGAMEEGEKLYAVSGPLGNPSHIEKFDGAVACVGGGVGVPAIYPIARAFKEAGNDVISIIGARTHELLIWEEEMKLVSSSLKISTDDGSYGTHGFVTDVLKSLIEEGTKIDLVVTVGPLPMMKFVSLTTKPYGVKTMVSLNPIMVDGTGMCGGCRVSVGGETKFTCVDGPEFDGHLVDFDELRQRQQIFVPQEKVSMEAYEESCRLA